MLYRLQEEEKKLAEEEKKRKDEENKYVLLHKDVLIVSKPNFLICGCYHRLAATTHWCAKHVLK